MSGYDIQSEVAAALAEVAGEVGSGAYTATLHRPPVDAADVPWDTPSSTLWSDTTLNVLQESWRDHEINGESIQRTDIKLMVEAGKIEPKAGDQLTLDGALYTDVLPIDTVAPSGVALYYVIRIRR